MANKIDWNVKARREDERRRAEKPRVFDGAVVRYNIVPDIASDRAEVVIETTGRSDVVIGPIRSEIAKEVFDLIHARLKREPSIEEIQGYKPVCPRGYMDCVRDPAYIKHHYPEWYADLYGDKTPEEAIHVENGCFSRFIEDPDERWYCYDDEDK